MKNRRIFLRIIIIANTNTVSFRWIIEYNISINYHGGVWSLFQMLGILENRPMLHALKCLFAQPMGYDNDHGREYET